MEIWIRADSDEASKISDWAEEAVAVGEVVVAAVEAAEGEDVGVVGVSCSSTVKLWRLKQKCGNMLVRDDQFQSDY